MPRRPRHYRRPPRPHGRPRPPRTSDHHLGGRRRGAQAERRLGLARPPSSPARGCVDRGSSAHRLRAAGESPSAWSPSPSTRLARSLGVITDGSHGPPLPARGPWQLQAGDGHSPGEAPCPPKRPTCPAKRPARPRGSGTSAPGPSGPAPSRPEHCPHRELPGRRRPPSPLRSQWALQSAFTRLRG